ncbi:MAG: hypothetical protein ACTSUC_09780 [Promethearchaeota archaeon]
MVSNFMSGMAGGAVVNIVIRAIDNYSKQFKKLDKNIKNQKEGFNKLSQFLKKTGIGYVAIAGAVTAFGISAVKAGIESERAFQQFNLVLGDTADIILNDLRKASKGLVSDFELVDNANKAMALGIAKNQISELLEVATARAKIFGRTVPQAFQDLTIGIGRQSRLILDNLGIIIDLDDAYNEYAESIGKSSDALSELEKKQALTNQIIKETESLMKVQPYLMETTSEKLQRLSAGWDNFKEKVGLATISLYDLLSGSQRAGEHIESLASKIYSLEQESANAVSNLEGIKNALLGIEDVVLFGESEKGLEIAKKQAEINKKKLEILKLEQFDEGEWGIEKQKKQLEELEDQLEILKLEREVEFNDVKKIEKKRNDAFINQKKGLEVSTEIFLKSNKERRDAWDVEKRKIQKITKEVEKLADKLIEMQFRLSTTTNMIGSKEFEEFALTKATGFGEDIKDMDIQSRIPNINNIFNIDGGNFSSESFLDEIDEKLSERYGNKTSL